MKRKIPLEILESFQPVTDKNLDILLPVKDSTVLWHVLDTSEESEFFFKIVRQESSNGKPGYILEYSPKSKKETIVFRTWTSTEYLMQIYENWLSFIRTYNSIRTVHDDPILKSNRERFEKQFKILDEDADISSFDLNQQFFLNDYLNDVKKKIPMLKIGKSTEEIDELTDLEAEASAIQNSLTKETKNQVAKRLHKFWAKAQTIGLDIIKEILINVASEITTKLITGLN